MTETELCLWKLGLLYQTRYLACKLGVSIDTLLTELVVEKFVTEVQNEMTAVDGEDAI